MASPLRNDVCAVLGALRTYQAGSDKSLTHAVQRILVTSVSELRLGQSAGREDDALLAGWVASRIAKAENATTSQIRLETAAGLIAAGSADADMAAAFACLLEEWPSTLGRLVHCSRERISGLGEPLGRTRLELSRAAQRVGIVVAASRRLMVSNGDTEAVLSGLVNEADHGEWDRSLIALLRQTLETVTQAFDRPSAPKSTTKVYRISEAHDVRGPVRLELVKKRQQITRRHVASGPVQLGTRSRRGRRRGSST